MQLSAIPISVNVTDIDITYLEQNISQLKELMTLIFRKPLGCHIVKTTKLGHNQLAIIHMTAINPATDQIWSQQMNIYEDGTIGINGGQSDAAWRWKFSYLNKITRIIRFWMSENDGRNRTHKRTELISRELFEKTAWIPKLYP